MCVGERQAEASWARLKLTRKDNKGCVRVTDGKHCVSEDKPGWTALPLRDSSRFFTIYLKYYLFVLFFSTGLVLYFFFFLSRGNRLLCSGKSDLPQVQGRQSSNPKDMSRLKGQRHDFGVGWIQLTRWPFPQHVFPLSVPLPPCGPCHEKAPSQSVDFAFGVRGSCVYRPVSANEKMIIPGLTSAQPAPESSENFHSLTRHWTGIFISGIENGSLINVCLPWFAEDCQLCAVCQMICEWVRILICGKIWQLFNSQFQGVRWKGMTSVPSSPSWLPIDWSKQLGPKHTTPMSICICGCAIVCQHKLWLQFLSLCVFKINSHWCCSRLPWCHLAVFFVFVF